MAHDRDVAGIRCGAVLSALPDYIDGTLDAETRARVEAHLRGCDWCEHFGGAYAALVTTLRERLREAEPLADDVRQRLRQRLGLG
ncbi:MAG: zf-HC2 domain-containing protein [Myxococcota bacterium]